jgi:hypothetical protein
MGTCTADFGGLVGAFHFKFSAKSLASAPTTIRETQDYRKFSQSRQHLGCGSDSKAVTWVVRSGMWIRL